MFGIDDALLGIGGGSVMSGLGGFLGGAGGLLSSLIGGGLNLFSANRQMQFQRDMANTAIQRRVADLRASGLNPLLAVTSGTMGGAATPQGAMGSFPDPDMVNSAVALRRSLVEVEFMKEQARKMQAEADSARVSADIDIARARTMSDKPDLIKVLPKELGGAAGAAVDALKPASDAISGGLSRVQDMLGPDFSAPVHTRTGVESGARRGSVVLPGGAVVERAVPGQLNILRLKRESR
jgi:hypothetical protein